MPTRALAAYGLGALEAGKSIRWVAEQLGHSNPELTLRVYGHVLPSDGVVSALPTPASVLALEAPIAAPDASRSLRLLNVIG